MTVNKERVELWAQALESERYVQCYGNLRVRGMLDVRHCAYGVAVEVALANGCRVRPSVAWDRNSLCREIVDWYGFKTNRIHIRVTVPQEPSYETLMDVETVNDHLRLPFWDIAQAIRTKYLKDDDVHGH
jgi:hypothetical protein